MANKPEGNKKLAKTKDGETIAETRGESGMFVGPGSSGSAHPSGKPWQWRTGGWDTIPTFTLEERAVIVDMFRSLDETPAREPAPPPTVSKPSEPSEIAQLLYPDSSNFNGNGGDLSPGADFNKRAEWLIDLLPDWTFSHVDEKGHDNITRPGKHPSEGSSATLKKTEDGENLYVFTTSTVFEPEIPYTKFGAYTLLTQGSTSDAAFSRAASELRKQGYGTPLKPKARKQASTSQDSPGKTPSAWAGQKPDHTTRRLVVQRASEIQPRKVDWLWDSRIAAGTLSLLAGREGLGKSTLAAWIAGCVTRGQLPGDYHGKPRAVIVAATEDSWEHTLVPRFTAAGADLDLILRVDVETAAGFTTGLNLPTDINDLADLATEHNVGLLILDPIMSRLDSLDTHRDNEVRIALEPLVRAADDTGTAILGLIHVNKSSNDPLNAVMGSKAFTAVARSVSTVVADPEDEDDQRRLFGTVKNNLAPSRPSSQVFIVETAHIDSSDGKISTGKLAWKGEVDTTIKAAMADTGLENRTAVDEAAEWLEDYLSINPGIQRTTVIREATKAGHSESAIKRAANKISVLSQSSGFPRQAHWSLAARKSGQSVQTASSTPGESFFNELTEPTGSDKGKHDKPVGSVGPVSSFRSTPSTSEPTGEPTDRKPSETCPLHPTDSLPGCFTCEQLTKETP